MKDILDNYKKCIDEEKLVINYVKVLRDGDTIGEYSRLDSKTRLNIWSISKTVVSLGVGIAIEEGVLKLEEKICDCFSEYVPQNPSQNLLDVEIHNLLTMSSGLKDSLFTGDDPLRYTEKDWLNYFFKSNFEHRPGTKFLYSNFNTFVLSCLIEKRTGKNLLYFLRDRLFEPIGIGNPDWTLDPKGHVYAANGLYLTIDELANLGQLILQKGEWKGKNLVPSNYITEATSVKISESGEPGSYGYEYWNGYGYQFWINPDGVSFRGDGKFGQFLIVLPNKNAVIAVQSLESKPVFPAVWESIAQVI